MKEKYNIPKIDLKKLLEKNIICKEIAQIFNCSTDTIINRINKYNLKGISNSKSTSKTGKSNPAKRLYVKNKISKTILNQYKNGKEMGFKKIEKTAHKINIKKDKCEFCSSKKNLVIHHIDSNQSNHLKTNIEILCRSCHIAKHYQPYMKIGKLFEFEAAHKLKNISKCKRIHGHSYKFEVICGGRLDKNGMVINFGKVKEIVNRRIINSLDHYYLNKQMKLKMPTAENMLVWIFKELNEELKGIKELRLWETRTSVAILKDKFFIDMIGE